MLEKQSITHRSYMNLYANVRSHAGYPVDCNTVKHGHQFKKESATARMVPQWLISLGLRGRQCLVAIASMLIWPGFGHDRLCRRVEKYPRMFDGR